MTPSPAAFRRAVAALDPGAFVRFVAAVHAAGEAVEAVERDGAVLVVRGRETRRVLPVADRRGPLRGPAPVGTAAPPVDEVVAQVDAEAARRIAAEHGARYRSPADLYARVRYGLAPAAGRRLIDDHLDVESGADAADPVRRHGAVAVAVAALVVLAGLAAGVPVAPPFGPSAPAGTVTDSSPGVTDSPSIRADRGAPTDPYPPGVGPRGVTDADALASAHAAAAGARYYRWTVVAGRTGATWAGVDVEAAGPRAVVRAVADRPANATGTVSFRTYSDGNHSYVGIAGPNGTQYVRETVRVRAGEEPRYAARAARYVARYLSGDGGDLTAVDAAGLTVYRLNVTEPPSGLAGGVSDYAATALVTREGFVVALDVTYLRHGDGGDETAVAFRFRYVPYRGTTDPPPWYEALRASTNGTRLLSPGAGD